MTPEEYIFNQYRGKRVLLDANLLLLYMIGSFERGRIENFKRTSGFSAADFDLLATLLQSFKTIVTTPHVLTEVGNLANSLPANVRRSWLQHFAAQTAGFLEVFTPAVDVMRQSSFADYGLTDAAVQAGSTETLVLTEDFPLSGFLSSRGVAVLNFNHLALFAR